jgi:hypothetical protein
VDAAGRAALVGMNRLLEVPVLNTMPVGRRSGGMVCVHYSNPNDSCLILKLARSIQILYRHGIPTSALLPCARRGTSFRRAARRLSISQPPLSLNIQQLEASVGARLFERDSRGVRLTAAGRAFRESAMALLAQAEEARLLAREIEAGAVGRLRVGFVGRCSIVACPSA